MSAGSDEGTERAGSVIVAAGAWTSALLPELRSLLTVTRHVQAWFAPAADTDVRSLPCWLYDRGAGERPVYGLAPDPPAPADPDGTPSPSRHPKAALHGSDIVVDPDRGATPVAEADIEQIRSACAAVAPSIAGIPAHAATCLYTMSPDGQGL